MSQTYPIAVFLSGSGRTLENILRHRDGGTLPVDICVVISSSAKVRGVTVARDAGIDTRVVLKSAFPDDAGYRDAMFGPCRDAGVRLVVMAGFLKHVLVPDDFHRRVINIHPSLIPAFAGHGMYGHHIHEAAIERGVQFSGCTVHYVDNDYDHGPIILQRVCAVPLLCTPSELAARVFELECEAMPTAINAVLHAI